MISIFLKRFLVITFAVICLLSEAEASAQNECHDCKQRVFRGCMDQAQKRGVARQLWDQFLAKCEAVSCEEACRPVSAKDVKTERKALSKAPEETPRERPLSCAACIQSLEDGECLVQCKKIGYGSSPKCRTRCARLRCARSCPLPGEYEEEALDQGREGRDCYTCKLEEESGCKTECNDRVEEAGHTACLVSCVERQCYKECNPSEFD